MRCALVLLAGGCTFTTTNDPIPYEDLTASQQSATDRINANLRLIHHALHAEGGPGIDGILDNAEVGFAGIVVAANLGDGRARVSVWQDLTAAQHELVAGWWGVSVPRAEELYPGMAYDYMALHLGALEYIYVVQEVERVFRERPRYNVERDAARLVGAFARGEWPGVMSHMALLCGPMRAQYDAVWGTHYGEGREVQQYFQDHLRELADPEHPTGYFYYLCRWTEDARNRNLPLAAEMQKIKDRFGYP